jgi:4-diphosphocytidyl-2-C-methyl-D-erythritol kinase
MRRALEAGDVPEIGRRLLNRLLEPALALRPELAEYLRRLAELGPAGQLMSGSGSTLFALCHDRAQAVRIARALRHGAPEKGRPTVYWVRSCA